MSPFIGVVWNLPNDMQSEGFTAVTNCSQIINNCKVYRFCLPSVNLFEMKRFSSFQLGIFGVGVV